MRLPKNQSRDLTHDTGHQMAVTRQILAAQIARLREIHLTAFDDAQQMLSTDAKLLHPRHQGLQDRVLGASLESGDDRLAPPREFARRNGGVTHLIDHIVNFSAKGIKGRDRGSLGSGEKQKGVIKGAA